MEIVNNKRAFQFEITFADGEIAYLQYRWLKARMVLMHTVVPASHRGQGIGDTLARYVLEHARAHGLRLIVYCPFVQAFIKKHPEYNALIDG